MGYRFYFYAIPKTLVKEIQKCRTNEAYLSVCKAYGIEYESWDGEAWCPPYHLGREVYGFGKEIDFYSEASAGKPLFSGAELEKEYQDYGAVICGPEVFRRAIQSYADKIKSVYEDLLREKSIYPFCDMSQADRMKEHIADHLHHWDCPYLTPYNLDLNTPNICNSWLYEHAIFELVRCYKTFDWEKEELVFMGW